MMFSARTLGLDGLGERLAARLSPARVATALDAAAARLARAAEARLGAPPTVRATPGLRLVGSGDPAAVARETGTLATPPDPWLGPAVAEVKASGPAPADGGAP